MKRILILLALFFVCTTSAYSDDFEIPHITVFGTAEEKVVPDKMLWNLQVMNKGQLLENVSKKHIDLVEKITRLLKSENIKDDLQTTRMEFNENWVYKKSSRIKEGYFARTYITFSMTDFSKYKKIWLELAEIDGVSVMNISYDHTERISIQNKTRLQALSEAKQKAKVLAESIGSKIAEPLLIEEEQLSPGIRTLNVSRFAEDGGSQGTSSVSPGMIPIRMRIKASFRLVTTGL
ncbi:SIMPL domain-containing protein [Thermodesulfobacteriota bacterium]